jgi:hypothetical protein
MSNNKMMSSLTYTDVNGDHVTRVYFGPATRFKDIDVVDKPYNRQNILAANWGTQAAQHSVGGWYQDRFLRNQTERYYAIQKLMGGDWWNQRGHAVLNNDVTRQKFLKLAFGDAHVFVDYCEIVEFTNVSSGFPTFHVGGYSLTDAATRAAYLALPKAPANARFLVSRNKQRAAAALKRAAKITSLMKEEQA